MAKFPPDWDGFFAAIEGRPSAFSGSIVDGQPDWAVGASPKAEQQNLKLLVDLLRSSSPLAPEVRGWLADLFDEQAESEFQVKALVRRRRGKPAAVPGQHIEAVRRFRNLLEKGVDRKTALWEAGKENKSDKEPKISRSTMEKAIADIVEAERIGRADAWGDDV